LEQYFEYSGKGYQYAQCDVSMEKGSEMSEFRAVLNHLLFWQVVNRVIFKV